MQILKIIFLAILTLGVLGAGGYFGYNAAYAYGETTGYEAGYTEGEDYGYTTGTEQGYSEGYETGDETGYTRGYAEGEETGYDAGYNLGKETGYRDGYSAGSTEGREIGYETGYTSGIEEALGHGYTLRDPTYTEAVAFMSTDRTSENEYNDADYGVYVCSHFSRDTCNNAEAAGFRCALVELRYAGSGHTIVAFDTIDRGLVYFEPQSDERAVPEIGKRYYECVIPAPGTYYKAPDYDDTIRDILIIW